MANVESIAKKCMKETKTKKYYGKDDKASIQRIVNKAK